MLIVISVLESTTNVEAVFAHAHPGDAASENSFTLERTTIFFSMTELRGRGWTPSMVNALLGSHDSIDLNVQRPKRPRRLWCFGRICEAENTDEFKKRQLRAVERSARIKTMLQHASVDVIEAARFVPIDMSGVPVNYLDAVKRTAEINGVQEFCDDVTGLRLGWECLAVEFLLDASTHIESVLDDYFGRPGVTHARAIIRERLLDAIADRFPELGNECARRKCCD